MEFRNWKGFCLCDLGGGFPPEAVPAQPFAPLVLTVRRDVMRSRGCFAVQTAGEALEPEGVCALLPSKTVAPPELDALVRRFGGATVLNTAFAHAFDFLVRKRKTNGLRAVLVGLGDVGGTLLTALKLLGCEFSEIAVFDPNEALCRRYGIELNQVLSPDGAPLPKVTICSPERLFDCDVFLFTASRGVPPVGSAVQDVRMAQFERNREMLDGYAARARAEGFGGLFCQISSFPAYYAGKEEIDFTNGRVYGPHGTDLVVANDPVRYDEMISKHLTDLTVTANLRVRELGFKPYIAPALSSAAVSILRLLRGETCFSAVPMGAAYFGCRSRTTPAGILTEREPLHPALVRKLEETHRRLEEFFDD